jgi:hypothetical protein
MSRIARWLPGAAALCAAALFFTPAPAEEPKVPSLDGAMRKAAPDIVALLHKRGYQNVGVLKFAVAEGDKGELKANVGSLNRTLADRLEVALTLALNDDDDLGIIAGASDAANSRTNHLDPEKRANWFKVSPSKFSVPWKLKQKIEPNAFLTGEARISDDRLTVNVKVQLFDNDKHKNLETIAEFKAANDYRTLTETGLTFAVPANARGAPIDKALAMNTKTTATSSDSGNELKKKAEAQLADLKGSPVKLQILYDNEPQTPDIDPGATYSTNVLLQVPPPKKEDAKLTFKLTNEGDETYGVVLRVNGRNTIFDQRDDPLSCYKWILKKSQSVTIKGPQQDKKSSGRFKVTRPDQLNPNEFSYGDNPGTFDLIVFREADKAATVLVKKDDPETQTIAAIGRGTMVTREEPPASDLKSFKSQLRREGVGAAAEGRSAGYWLPDPDAPPEKNPVEVVPFTPDPAPAVSVTIRYFALKK